MKNIITIQHTQSVHHTNGMIGAWTDWDLSELGRKQADNIGRKLQSEIVGQDYIMYSSDLKRAQQTAEIVGSHLKLQSILKQEIREVNVGITTPTTVEWYNQHKEPKDEHIYDPHYRPMQGAESDFDLWQRIYPFMRELVESKHNNIIIVSHGIALSFFFAMWVCGNFSFLENGGFRAMSGGVSKLCIDNYGKRIIQTLNDMSYKEEKRNDA